jgi:hypothetical protein
MQRISSKALHWEHFEDQSAYKFNFFVAAAAKATSIIKNKGPCLY